jgi:hypothetical protein
MFHEHQSPFPFFLLADIKVWGSYWYIPSMAHFSPLLALQNVAGVAIICHRLHDEILVFQLLPDRARNCSFHLHDGNGTNISLKGTVQRDLRGVKSGINR